MRRMGVDEHTGTAVALQRDSFVPSQRAAVMSMSASHTRLANN